METEVIFDNKIPYGNGLLRGVENKNGNCLEVAVTPEAKNGPETLWFCFRQTFKNREGHRNRLKLVLKYFYNSPAGFPSEKINPVTRPALSFEFPCSQVRGTVLETTDYIELGGTMADIVLDFLKR